MKCVKVSKDIITLDESNVKNVNTAFDGCIKEITFSGKAKIPQEFIEKSNKEYQQFMTTLIDRTLSVGLLHAAASELMIRRAMQMHEAQGLRLRHEAKQAFSQFNADYKRLMRSYERVQEIATDKRINEDTAQLFDAFLNDSSTLAMISMLYFNATNQSNPNWQKNTQDIVNILKNLTLATTSPAFPITFINQFAPTV